MRKDGSRKGQRKDENRRRRNIRRKRGRMS